MLPKDFLNDFKNTKEAKFWFKINDVMLLENDGSKSDSFNELVDSLSSLNKEIFDMEYLKEAEVFLQKEIKRKGVKNLFKETLPSIDVKEKDLLNNKDFLNNYFKETGVSSLVSWENSTPEKSLTWYEFDYDKFKDFAQDLRRNIYYKFLKEGSKNKGTPVDKNIFNKYNDFFVSYFNVRGEQRWGEQDGVNFNIESKKIILTLKDRF